MSDTIFNKEPISFTNIRFQDCDPLGHLNNARYIDYFINAREDHLVDEYGLDIYDQQKKLNINWVIGKTKIVYLSPVFFREQVALKTRLINHTENSLRMEGVMLGKDCKQLKSIVWIEFKHFDLKSGKLITHSAKLTKLFDKILFIGINNHDFEKRIKEIVSSQKMQLET